jgi:adenylate kinase
MLLGGEMIVGVYGISGVGKTTFSKKLQEIYPSVSRFSASELIAKFNGVIDYDDLECDSVIENQLKLIKAMEFISNDKKYKNVVIELHNVIETKEGLVFIDNYYLNKLGLDKSFFMKKDPKVIYANRMVDIKKRHSASVNEIDNIQNKSLERFIELYNNVGGSIISGVDGDISSFSELFGKC